MSTTSITAWGHAGVRLERDGQVLAMDPGTLTDPAVLDGADAVLVTHEHADHVVPEQLAAAARANDGLEVWAPAPLAARLTDAGAPGARVHAATPGDTFTAAGFAVRALGGEHAVIHPALPAPVNLAYLVDEVALHPGDSFTPAPDGVSLHALFLPISAPWMKLSEAVDYLRQTAPQVVVPIHDGILSDAGRMLTDRIVGGLAGTVQYRRLPPGETLEVVTEA